MSFHLDNAGTAISRLVRKVAPSDRTSRHHIRWQWVGTVGLTRVALELGLDRSLALP